MNPETRPPTYQAPPAGGFGAGLPATPGGFGPIQHYQGDAGARPVARNALVFGLIPVLIGFFGPTVFSILAAFSELYWLSFFGNLLQWGCIVWFFVNAMRATDDLRRASKHVDFPRWPMFLPFLNIVWWCSAVIGEVKRARTMRGLPPPRHGVILYFFFPLFALQMDLNDLAE